MHAQLFPKKKWMNGKDFRDCSLELKFAYTFAGACSRNKSTVPANVFFNILTPAKGYEIKTQLPEK
jgi:hypothetical protein